MSASLPPCTAFFASSSLIAIGSGGAPLSTAGREELAETFPHVILNDGYGASETGAQARSFGDGKFASFDNETLVLNPETFEATQRRLATANLSHPWPPRLLYAWYASHPTLAQRIAIAQGWQQRESDGG